MVMSQLEMDINYWSSKLSFYNSRMVRESLQRLISAAEGHPDVKWPGCPDEGCEFYGRRHRHEQQWRDVVILHKENR